jgi:hypothetical protein
MARANYAPLWEGPMGVKLVSMGAKDDGEHGKEACVVLNLEQKCRSRFEYFNPKSEPKSDGRHGGGG